MKNILFILTGLIFAVLIFSKVIEAKEIGFFFYGDEILRQEMTHGQVVSSILCKNKIDFNNLNIDVIRTVDAEDIFVSPNEKYLVFHGAENVKAPWQYFLVDITKCSVVKELGKQYSNKEIISSAFSPDSKKMYIKWAIIEGSNSSLGVAKEYSGPGFKNEWILKNMPNVGYGSSQGFWVYNYKFSRDGKILLSTGSSTNTWIIQIYDIAQDEIITSFPMDSFFDFKNKKYYRNEDIPDITNGFLLYNFGIINGGTEMDVFDYKSKKVVNKIINSQKGIGTFSGDGKKIIFSEFPNEVTWKRNVIVYDKSTGSVLGQAVLDEQDDIVDVSSDGTKLIYKRNGVQKTIALRPPS